MPLLSRVHRSPLSRAVYYVINEKFESKIFLELTDEHCSERRALASNHGSIALRVQGNLQRTIHFWQSSRQHEITWRLIRHPGAGCVRAA